MFLLLVEAVEELLVPDLLVLAVAAAADMLGVLHLVDFNLAEADSMAEVQQTEYF
jgi:hypothetical protein